MLRALLVLIGLAVVGGLLGVGGTLYVFYHFGRDLPDYRQLADYAPAVMTRVHAGDGRLLAEYAIEKRVFVPIGAMPRRVIRAFLSAEDKTFYDHPGIDIPGIVVASLRNLQNLGSNRRPVGASTITQQVAKNFLLTNEVSIARKVKEAILAFRIERAYPKDRILELYLNEIYLGFGSYGVAAAAINYFNKSLDELTVAETAFLAALPKAPNNYHPIRQHEAAVARRDWVIGRMLEDGYLDAATARQAMAEPLVVRDRDTLEFVTAGFFAEEVRRELAGRYGESQLYKGGLSVRTTLDPRLQAMAERTLRDGLRDYDRRHGWRGPVTRLESLDDWPVHLAAVEAPVGLAPWQLAVVLEVDGDGAAIGLGHGERGLVPFAEMKWARPQLKEQTVGRSPRAAADVVKPGDVVAVEPVAAQADGKPYPDASFALRQVPEIQGAIVVMDPHTGRVLALQGGYAYEAGRSEFNRAVQAKRQPGSAFKPIVYLAALEQGLTPATLIHDGPFVVDQGPGLPKWRPSNYSKEFYGDSTMRLGIEKSRNLMTVRLAQFIGMDKVAIYAERLGVVDDLEETLAMSLGAAETTLMRMTTAYCMFVNGGKRVVPALIDRIQDRDGLSMFRHDARPCPSCVAASWMEQPVPEIPDTRDQVADPASAYQIVSMLEGVVLRGTGRRIATVGKPLAGKTGTTNDSMDAWFIGFSPDLAVGIFTGFDEPRPLGARETGSSVAAPVFRDFMAEALEGKPGTPFRIPPGVRMMQVDARTGRPASYQSRNTILEAFKPGTEPTGESEVLGAATDYTAAGVPLEGAPAAGTGGLY